MKKFHPIRLLVFAASTVALASFFEAGRLVSFEMNFDHVWVSVLSLLVFILTLFVMGYWIYTEEKEKNNLRIKFGLYEWFHRVLTNRKLTK